MMLFIKTYTYENIKYKLLILYLLNVTDILFTVLLLSTGLFAEANFLMVKAIQSPSTSFILKIVLPAVLLLYIYIRMKNASELQLKQSNIILNIITGVYILINIFHLIWFFLFLFTQNIPKFESAIIGRLYQNMI
ncbi:hypothetical protein KPL51_07225 [Clostridium bowmanii]|nr:hypothetical protein [Clostridium bowmanii]